MEKLEFVPSLGSTHKSLYLQRCWKRETDNNQPHSLNEQIKEIWALGTPYPF